MRSGAARRRRPLYAQDAWRFLPRWKLVYGVRYEDWHAYDGFQALGRDNAAVCRREPASRFAEGFIVVRCHRRPDACARRLRVRIVFRPSANCSRGKSTVRRSSTTIRTCKPEDDLSKELTAEWAHWNGVFRLSLFQDDVKNTIFSQTDTTVIPNVTNFQNIGKVRSRGVETSYSGQDVVVHGLDLIANVAYTQSKILANAQNPATVGKYFYRIPLWRANVAATYHFDDAFRVDARGALFGAAVQHAH